MYPEVFTGYARFTRENGDLSSTAHVRLSFTA